MIKINLLKDSVQQERTPGLPVRMIVVSVIVLISAAVIIGIMLRPSGNRPKVTPIAHVEKKSKAAPLPDTAQKTVLPDAKPVDSSGIRPTSPVPAPEKPKPAPEPEKAKPAEEIKSAADIVPDDQKGTFAPSTHTTTEVVENVVLDRSRKSGDELLSLAYREMSRGEKINYEISFSKKVFELLTRAVPEGIGFGSLSIDSFTVIKATGFGSGRDLVTRLFSSLRYENLLLRERPVSSIRPIGRGGYRFDFACEAAFGIDTKDTFIATSNLKPHETFTGVYKAFLKSAARDGVRLQGEPNRLSSEKAGGFRRYTYRLSGSATYRDFVKLVLDLHKQRFPCSFARIHLKARSDTKISIDADIVFNFLD